jgi:hypothetical protein
MKQYGTLISRLVFQKGGVAAFAGAFSNPGFFGVQFLGVPGIIGYHLQGREGRKKRSKNIQKSLKSYDFEAFLAVVQGLELSRICENFIHRSTVLQAQ